MRISLILIALFLITSCKTKVTEKAAPTVSINAEEVKEMMTYLSSDELMGRKTGSQGIEMAAKFFEERFKNNGIQPYFESYRDNFKVNDLNAFNVVGFVKGNDKELQNEVVLIGAHYDHVGVIKAIENDSIANGANDNATGSVAVSLIGEYFGKFKTNKRSLMFVLFSAEEMGLQGSKHLASLLKEKGVDLYTVINFEMIGVPFIDRDYTAFATGFNLSNMSDKINEYTNSNLIGFSEVSKQYNLFKRSDNYPFYEAFRIPSHTISSCDLSNYEYYHHVDDETEKQNFEHMASLIEQLIPAIEKMASTPSKEIQMN